MAETTTADYIYDTTTFAPPTSSSDATDYIISSTASPLLHFDLSASAAVTATPASSTIERLLNSGEQMPQQHNQITFEIPSHHDLEHINTLHKFNTLLQRIGNVAYDTFATSAHTMSSGGSESSGARSPSVGALGTPDDRPLSLHHPFGVGVGVGVDATGQRITSEQISRSAVLNLADLKAANAGVGGGFLESLFGDADMHVVINYLWIGVVTALVVLSVIFILFSCYFYRKFRQWKKCNKDIRNHLHNDMYTTDGHIVGCDRLMDAHGQHPATTAAAAYYQQIESPPCYTIATGLPSYDEALHRHLHQHHHLYHQQHQQQQQQQQHYAYGMKLVYPTMITALSAQQQPVALAGIYDRNCNNGGSNNNNNNTDIAIVMEKQQSFSEQWQQQHQQQKPQLEQLIKQKSYKVSPVLTPVDESAEVAVLQMDAPAANADTTANTTYDWDIAELHNLNLPSAELGVAAPLLLSAVNATARQGVEADEEDEEDEDDGDEEYEDEEYEDEVITIRLDDMTPTIALAATSAPSATTTLRLPTLYFNDVQQQPQQQQQQRQQQHPQIVADNAELGVVTIA